MKNKSQVGLRELFNELTTPLNEIRSLTKKELRERACLEKTLPLIKCLPYDIGVGYGQKFWCPYCRCWHSHGIGNGHRAPHCNQASPTYKNGYIIKMMSMTELREIQKEISVYLDDEKNYQKWMRTRSPYLLECAKKGITPDRTKLPYYRKGFEKRET